MHHRQRQPAQKSAHTYIWERSSWNTLAVCVRSICSLCTSSKRTPCTGGGEADRLHGSQNTHDTPGGVPSVLLALRGADPDSPVTAVG